jgi:hypothetical protein
MKIIESNIQDIILQVLPADGPLAIELMCQLLANMILAIRGPSVEDVVTSIHKHLDFYNRTDGILQQQHISQHPNEDG